MSLAHTGHGIYICQWGFTHGQCRCPDATFINVVCDDPSHNPKNAYVPKHAKKTQKRP